MDAIGDSVFVEIAGLLALAALFGVIGLALRQPLIVAFIATGIVAGGEMLGIVRSAETIELLAEIGITVLLFLVGLKLDLSIIRSLGAVALATGLGQVIFTSVVGFGVCLALGLDPVTSLYVAVALTFSSTIIIVKLLSDKRELDSLHGRIALGFLIVQDIAVVLAMVVLSAFGVGIEQDGLAAGLARVFGGMLLLLGIVGVFVRYLAEPLVRYAARVPELLVAFSLALAVVFATLGDLLGFGKELGGLLAGISLASTTFREAIASRLASLRDFLLLFFFLGLGSRLELDLLGEQIPAALALSAFVLIGNPLIVMAIMGWMGYRKRTGFLAGLTVAQISEFSLIFAAMGVGLGHIAPPALGLVTLVGLVTITLSTYMILYSHVLYRVLEPYLGPFERRVPRRELAMENGAAAAERYDVILFGLGRYGREIAKTLIERGARVLGIDFDPEAVDHWRRRGQPALYGDAADPDFPATLPWRGARAVMVATSPVERGIAHDDSRVAVIHALRQLGFAGTIAVRCNDAADLQYIRHAGADILLVPFADAADYAAGAIGFPAPVPEKDGAPHKPRHAAP